jgi:hypothetical protein
MIQYDVTLTVIQGRNAGDRLKFTLQSGQGIHLGRSRENDLVVPDPKASKLHAVIELTDSGLKLFDLNSTAGTFLMGFPVRGEGEPLKLSDEFKLADTLLSIYWEKREVVQASSKTTAQRYRFENRNSKLIAGLLFLLLSALLFDSYGSSPTGVVTQLSAPVQFSETKGYGYSKDGDRNHPYEIKLNIPPGDLNIEFSARSALPVTIFRDDTLIGRIGVSDNWTRYSLLLRDQVEGPNGVLRFVGNDPSAKGKLKEWVVGKLRYNIFEENSAETFNKKYLSLDNKQKLDAIIGDLQEALESCLTMYSTSDGMWSAKNALQNVILNLLKLTGEFGTLIPILEQSETPSISRYETKILELLTKPTKSLWSDDDLNRMLGVKEVVLIELLSELESELWRRALNRLNSSLVAAKAQNYRQALLDRLNLEKSFPDQQDLRFKETRKLIDQALPKQVLSKAERILREAR